MTQATGEYVAIFDADFVPPKDILRNVVDHFSDPKVGMVQVRWDHLNRGASLLTKGQAIFLDGHFVIEHTARNYSGRFMHFNGTAGVWRRATIGAMRIRPSIRRSIIASMLRVCDSGSLPPGPSSTW